MKRYLLGLIGLALLGGSPLWAAEGCDGGCATKAACDTCRRCCPRCGCCLVPVCHISCTTKKTTEYKYKSVCETICVPGVTPLCKGCGDRDGSRGCASECNAGSGNCGDGCGCKCLVRDVKKLVKYPVTKETPVRTCTVQWTCPNCAGCGRDGAASATDVVPPKTTEALPSPPGYGTF